MLDQQIEASGLPARFYTDPEYLEQEIETHFVNGWVGIGVTQRIPKSGDVMPVDVAGRPLLMTRDRDGEVRVFHNACRHRGTQLVTEPCHQGNGLITCLYHAWSYRLDGRLAAAPDCGFDSPTKEKLGLLPVRMAIWWDVVFVNLSGTAEPFEEFIQPLVKHLAKFDFSPLRLAGFVDLPAQANWKIVAENAVDILHVPFVHSQLGPRTNNRYAHETHILSHNIFGYISPNMIQSDTIHLLPGPMWEDGPLNYKTAVDLHFIFPNTSLLVTPTFVQLSIRGPQGMTTTKQTYHIYMLGEDAVEQHKEQMIKSLVGVATQDLETLRRQQLARTGNATDQGYMVPDFDDITAAVFKRIAHAYDEKTEKVFAYK